MSEEKNCLNCKKNLIGRSDKKFCNDYCRNEFNNKLHKKDNTLTLSIHKKLKKNQQVLQKILGGEETKKSNKENMLNHGFDFQYLTNFYKNKKGDTYYFCYEFGYLPLDNDWFLIVKRKD